MHLSNVWSQIINDELLIEYFQATLLMSRVLSCFSLETKKELNPEPSPSKSFPEIVTRQISKNLSPFDQSVVYMLWFTRKMAICKQARIWHEVRFAPLCVRACVNNIASFVPWKITFLKLIFKFLFFYLLLKN